MGARTRTLALTFTMGALAAACGGRGLGGLDAPADRESSGRPAGTAGGPSAAPATPPFLGPYPAGHTQLPIVDYNGGPVMASPSIVSITFDGDDLASTVDRFASTVGGTSWWDTVRDGYCQQPAGPCVGPVTAAAHVVLPALDAVTASTGFVDSLMGDSALQTFLRDQIAAGRVPAPTSDTLYMLYMPAHVLVTMDNGASCSPHGFDAYHNTMKVPAGDGGSMDVPFALIARCSSDPAALTRAASHELIEAATDPIILSPGYTLMSELWAVVLGTEVADLCVDLDRKVDTVEEAGLTLARAWSNGAARASQNPCVPVPPGEVYFNTSFEMAPLQLGEGESVKIQVDAFSDAPTDDWQLDAIDFASRLFGSSAYLRLQLDRPLANNGTTGTLTITAMRDPPLTFGAPFLLVSRSPNHTHVWPGTVLGK
jgi:hypothetical protein